MRTTLLSFVLSLLMVVGCSTAKREPISFECPTGWTVEHAKDGRGLHTYTVIADTPERGLLEMSQRSPDHKGEQADKSDLFPGPRETRPTEALQGKECHGSYAFFAQGTDTKSVLVIFNVFTDPEEWSGRFVGSPDSWKRALALLESIKKP